MQIKNIDFKRCNNLNNWVDFINSLPPHEYEDSEYDWKNNRVYIYAGENSTTLRGVILLRKKHGKYDGLIIRQELKVFLNRQCIDVKFTEINENKISLIATECHCIIVNSNKNLIPCFCGNSSTEPLAKKLKVVSHYTRANSAIKILTDNIFVGKSLSRYKSEADFVPNENSRRLYFICCFSSNLAPNDLMWDRFADKHKGCKIDFLFKHTLADAFPLNIPVKCKDKHGKQYVISSGFSHADGTLPNVFFTVHYSMAQYTNDLSNKTVLQVYDNGCFDDFTISPYVGRNILSKFEYQNEVRILLQLDSFNRTKIPFIQNIQIPFSTAEIDKIILTIGKNATDSTRNRINNAVGNSPIITIRDERNTMPYLDGR